MVGSSLDISAGKFGVCIMVGLKMFGNELNFVIWWLKAKLKYFQLSGGLAERWQQLPVLIVVALTKHSYFLCTVSGMVAVII